MMTRTYFASPVDAEGILYNLDYFYGLPPSKHDLDTGSPDRKMAFLPDA
jgi:hypothetical protein